jgi:hypothetical protein
LVKIIICLALKFLLPKRFPARDDKADLLFITLSHWNRTPTTGAAPDLRFGMGLPLPI